jgi:tetratricopeptide (TPR) repeat protein
VSGSKKAVCGESSPRASPKPFSFAACAFGFAAFLGLAAWIYGPSLRGDWIWDDAMYVPQNPALRSLAGLRSIWLAPTGVNYFPITFTVQWVQWHLWGNATLGYHLTNVALHSFNALLLGVVVGRLANAGNSIDRSDGGGSVTSLTAAKPGRGAGTRQPVLGRAGWAAAFLFLVHPLAVESVAWICELKNVLSLTFLLGAILAYLAYDQPAADSVPLRGRTLAYGTALALFLFAMLSKSTVAGFPIALLLFAWWQRGRLRWADVLASAPFFSVSIGLGLVTIWFEHHRTVAMVTGSADGLATRIAAAGSAIVFYLSKCAIPAGLMPNYPRWVITPTSAAPILAWAGIVGLTAYLWRNRTGFGRPALFAWGCFLAALGPILGLIPMAYQRIAWVADHFAYFALVAVVGFFATVWSKAMGDAPLVRILRGIAEPAARTGGSAGRGKGPAKENLPSLSAPRAALAFVLVAAVAAMAIETHGYAGAYRSEESFWSYAADKNPESWTAQSSLGLALAQAGRIPEAIARFTEALRIKPDYAAAHSDLANLLGAQPGMQADAIVHYEAALRLEPNLAELHNNFAGFLAFQPGREADAEAHYETAIRLKPDYADAHKNFADLLSRLTGREAEAVSHYETALRMNPDLAEAHNNLGLILSLHPENRPEAQAHFESALRLNPDFAEAHGNLADVLSQEPGHWAEAASHYESALRLKPDSFANHTNFGLLLVREPGRDAEAIAQLESALRLEPNSFRVHYILGRELAKFPDRRAEAALHFAEAVKLNPDFAPARQALEILKQLAR